MSSFSRLVVAISPVTVGPTVQAVYTAGVIEPVTWAKVAPLVRGRIAELCACKGDEVTRDYGLARLDDPEARAMGILDELGMAKHPR